MSRPITNLLLLILGTVLALSIGEALVRTYYFGTRGLTYEWVNSFRTFSSSSLYRLSSDSLIGFELKPNISIQHKLTYLNTNSFGMNDKEYRHEKKPDVIRIAVIGDSFSMATGVGVDENYHALAEEHLKNRNVEILNFSVAAYNLRNYLGVIKRKITKFNCDYVVVGFCPYNDFDIRGYTINSSANGWSRSPFWHSYLGALLKHSYRQIVNENKAYSEIERAEELLSTMDSECKKKRNQIIHFRGEL